MASYLLLRNNKESGPFSIDDLLKCGLKPYDLVWIEGKSAAWRYPSEIEELKPYAPVVEEQPFDRFFKKTSPTSSKETNNQPQTKEQVEEKPIVQDIIRQEKAIEEKYSAYIPKKSVFVTMPGQTAAKAQNGYNGQSSNQYNNQSNGQHNGNSLNSQYAQKAATTQHPIAIGSQPVSKYEPVPEPEPAPAQTITVTENPEAAKIKFSQPLDEIKEMYVKTLQERKQKLSRKNYLASFKKAAVIIGLVALGILAGLAIKSETDSSIVGAQTIPTNAAIIPPDDQASEQSDKPVTEEKSSPVDNNSSVNDTPEDNPAPLPPQVKKQIEQRQEKELLIEPRTKKEQTTAPAVQQQRYEEPQAAVERDPATGERSRRVRSANDMPVEDKQIPKTVMTPRKSGLESMVSVSSNDYKRVAFGGIRNLELTVTNDSRFVLDKVTVELQYLKPSEEPLKTEFIHFRSVSPNGSMTMRIKDTNRGIKVAYKIIDIQAQQTETASRE